jgi:hypothetical protein
MMEKDRQRYSFLARLMWIPLFQAPIAYAAPKVLGLAALLGIPTSFLVGKKGGITAALIGYLLGCWLVSFGYKQHPADQD